MPGLCSDSNCVYQCVGGFWTKISSCPPGCTCTAQASIEGATCIDLPGTTQSFSCSGSVAVDCAPCCKKSGSYYYGFDVTEPTDGPCCGCDETPVCYEVSFPGVITVINCLACVQLASGVIIGGGGCVWRWAGNCRPESPFSGYSIAVTLLIGLWGGRCTAVLEVEIVSNDFGSHRVCHVIYEFLPDFSEWQCLGSNMLTKTLDTCEPNAVCLNWPDTITVTPSSSC